MKNKFTEVKIKKIKKRMKIFTNLIVKILQMFNNELSKIEIQHKILTAKRDVRKAMLLYMAGRNADKVFGKRNLATSIFLVQITSLLGLSRYKSIHSQEGIYAGIFFAGVFMWRKAKKN